MKKSVPYIIALGIYLGIILSTIDTAIVDGDSMHPILQSGQEVWGVKTEVFKRNDIVLADVTLAEGDTITMVKRVYGVEGDKIEIKDNTVYINGEKTKVLTKNTREGSFTLGQNEYFLLGDNPGTVWIRTNGESIKSRMEGIM